VILTRIKKLPDDDHLMIETCWSDFKCFREHWGDPVIDGRIILRGIFRKWEGIVGTGLSGLRIRTGGGHLLIR
jgi:hypothetical protein